MSSDPSNPTPPQPPAEQQDHAAVRLDKLTQIAALGVDPWGQRFDNHTPIAEVRRLEPQTFDTGTTGP